MYEVWQVLKFPTGTPTAPRISCGLHFTLRTACVFGLLLDEERGLRRGFHLENPSFSKPFRQKIYFIYVLIKLFSEVCCEKYKDDSYGP